MILTRPVWQLFPAFVAFPNGHEGSDAIKIKLQVRPRGIVWQGPRLATKIAPHTSAPRAVLSCAAMLSTVLAGGTAVAVDRRSDVFMSPILGPKAQWLVSYGEELHSRGQTDGWKCSAEEDAGMS